MFGIELCGKTLRHPLANAAGTCKKLDGEMSVEQMCSAETVIVNVGSATIPERMGNEGNVYYRGSHTAINALGLPNPGKTYYEKYLPEMVRRAHAAEKLLSFSGSGYTPDEFAELALLAQEAGADIFEANLSCPNVKELGAIYGFEAALIVQAIRAIRYKTTMTLAIKVPPYSNPRQLSTIARAVAEEGVDIVVACNTFPHGKMYDELLRPVITANDGRGGISGPGMKNIVLGQIEMWRHHLPDSIALAGVGGISTGRDVLEYLAAGATYVQMATTIFDEGPGCFSRILAEMVDLKD